MTSSGKHGLVPNLRFPEFREAEGWGSEFGDVVFAQISNKDHNSDLPVLAITQEQGAIPRNLIDYHVSVTDKSIEGYKVVEVGDFIISLRSFQGGIEYSRYKGICSPAYVILRLKSGHSADYFRHFLKTDQFIALLSKNLEGLRDGKMVSYKQFSELQLPTPSQKEQQKIADCLASLDELITMEAQQLDTLKTHKKGLMQQLFPAEGETLPTLRFPEFRDAGEWVEKTLSQITTAIFDGTHQTPTYTEDGIPFFSVENIVSGKSNKFISRDDYLDATIKNRPEKGDVLITRIGNIGFSTVVDWNYEFSIYVTLAVIKKDDNFNSAYLHGYLQSPQYQAEIRSKSLLNAVPCKINMDELRKTRVLLPSPQEQEKIADCLTSLDDLITAQTQKLVAFKTHKKGLMQQLFPVLDEVSA